MKTVVLGTLDRCIYCGSTQRLTDEHIIPYGLGGPWVLANASCVECCKATSRFELDVLRNLWGPARVALGMPTRRKHRNKRFPVILERNGTTETVEIDPAKFGVPVMFPHFEAPAYLSGRVFNRGISWNGYATHILPNPDYLYSSINAAFKPQRVSFTISYQPVELAKLLAKIALGFTIARLGPHGIKTSYITEAILNRRDDIGMWVGCNADGKIHSTAVDDFDIRLSFLNTPKRDAVAEIKLFGRLETPTYLVVVGEPNPEVLGGVHFDAVVAPPPVPSL